MTIRFTGHAWSKFLVLARHGFPVSRAQVEDVVTNPDLLLEQEEGKYLAQKAITERHVLRVIYRLDEGDQVVITFYPGRRSRYENRV